MGWALATLWPTTCLRIRLRATAISLSLLGPFMRFFLLNIRSHFLSYFIHNLSRFFFRKLMQKLTADGKSFTLFQSIQCFRLFAKLVLNLTSKSEFNAFL